MKFMSIDPKLYFMNEDLTSFCLKLLYDILKIHHNKLYILPTASRL